MLAQFKLMILSLFMATDVNTTSLVTMENLDQIKDISCLAQAVHGEAQNQTFEGKIAVAHVILNRVKSDKFPDSPCAVVKQKGQFKYRQVKINQNKPSEYIQMEDSVRAAILSINGQVMDPTHGSLYFVNLKWATDKDWLRGLRKVVKIDDHWFYAPKTKQVVIAKL